MNPLVRRARLRLLSVLPLAALVGGLFAMAPRPVIAAGPALFSDDFEADALGSQAAGWTVVSGPWAVAADGTHVLQATSNDTSTRKSISAGSPAWTDYKVSALVKAPSDGSAAVLNARYQDDNNTYSMLIKDNASWYLGSKVAGNWNTLAFGTFNYNSTSFYSLEIDVVGSTISGFINGSQVGSAPDTSFSAGAIDLMARNVTEFDNVVVTQVAPGPIPSPSPSASASASPSPSASPSASPSPSPSPSSSPGGSILVADDFEADALGSQAAGWNVVSGPWTVALDGSHVLQAPSNNTTTRKSIWAGSKNWTDYKTVVRVKPPGDGSATVLNARYQDDNNTYALLIKDNASWYLGRVVAGTWSTLLSGNLAYSANNWYTLELDVVGTSISPFINGGALGSVSDASISSGAVGLMARNVTEFDNVTVTTPSTGGPSPSPTPSPSPSVSPSPPPANAGTIKGFVTDAVTGAPQPGALVATTTGVTTSTDATGAYQMKVAPGTYTVIYSKPGYNSDFTAGIVAAASTTVTASKTLLSLPPQTAQDYFSRPDQPGIGTASDGNTWTVDPTYPNSVATLTNGSVFFQAASQHTNFVAWMGFPYVDEEVRADFDMATFNVDPSYLHGPRLLARANGSSNYILLTPDPANSTLVLWVQSGGAWTQLTSVPLTLSTNAWYHGRLVVIGQNIYGKVWSTLSPEPANWQITATQSFLMKAGIGGLRAAESDIYWRNYSESAVAVDGKVTDKTTGLAVAGATVTLDGARTTVTDSTGFYLFTGAATGNHAVTARSGTKVAPALNVNVAAGVATAANPVVQ